LKTKNITSNKSVNIITLGCSKNRVDSENLLTQLKAGNVDVFHESNEVHGTVIINTCGFIDNAKEESINTILEYAKLKEEGIIEKLIVTGCLSQRYESELSKEIKEVDNFYGTNELPAILKDFGLDYRHHLLGERLTTTPAHYAYVKISEGCNRTCSFCAIPLMRGKHISRSIEDLVLEVKSLVARGVKEIMLIAQELTYYGLDIYKDRKLPELLDRLSEIEGLEWIRLHYAYPSKFPMEIIDAMKRNDKVCNYLDMPLQHISDNMLTAMHRQITKQQTIDLIDSIRQKLPEITLRTTLLTGFPGETKKDFDELCRFVEETKFDRLGVFTYSHEEDTAAYGLKDNISAKVKQQRAATLMEIQQGISFEKNAALIGKQFKVLIDRKEDAYFVGRTEADSPEVDNEVLIDANKFYTRIGDFIQAEITDATDFDLFAKVV
jgi:ribosomal protein S12 methylthiotransferase